MKTSFSNDPQFVATLKSIELQINQKRLQDAVLQLNELGKTAQHDPRIYLLAARLADASGNAQGRLQAARKAHQLAPEWSVNTLHLATVLANHEASTEAMAMANLAIQQATTQKGGDADVAELLLQAAGVAQRFALSAQALDWLQKASALAPDMPAIRFRLAQALNETGDAKGAVTIYSELLKQDAANPALLQARMQANLRAGQKAKATQDAETLVAQSPDNEAYAFFLAVAKGEVPPTQPSVVIQSLFDTIAPQFDAQFVVKLQYKLPRDVAALIHQWHPDKTEDVLDLGCGTGLLGVALGPLKGVLVGVDLSGEMIKRAARHQVYDKFHQVNLLDALVATPSDLYNVITALDVLNYVGDLESLLPNAHRILATGGRLVFSCEASAKQKPRSGPGYTLESTYRYTHQRNYLERLLEEAGFTDYEIEERVLRYENDEPVNGYLVTARKTATA
jgi:predicted TPR repeat methyltransferase